jgi:uncharacterized protein (DUF2147 family)
MKRYLLLIFTLLGSGIIDAQSVDAEGIIGVWKSSDNSCMIKIDKMGDQFHGRIVWLGQSGDEQMILDENNPNEQLRKMPLKGTKIITELTFNDQENQWTGGKFYNYKEGAIYNCQISLQSSDRIQILKFASGEQVGKTEIWNRQ